MFGCLIVSKPIITYLWLPVCLISIKQSLLFFLLHWFLWMLAYIFLWLFDCLFVGKLGKMQTCMIESKHVWVSFSVSLPLWCISYLLFFVRLQSCMLENRFVFYWYLYIILYPLLSYSVLRFKKNKSYDLLWSRILSMVG